MRIYWKAAASLVTYAVMAGSASAFFMDGNTLWNNCQNFRPAATGYIVGVSDAVEAMNEDWGRCLPRNVMSGQLTDMVCLSLQQNPQTRHMEASKLSVMAISSALSC